MPTEMKENSAKVLLGELKAGEDAGAQPAGSLAQASSTEGRAMPMGGAVAQANRGAQEFHSGDIGKWKARQEDPFAEQNRKIEEKKAEKAAVRKKAMPRVIILAGALVALVVAAVIIFVATRPKPLAEVTSEEAATIADGAQKIFDKYTKDIDLQESENLSEKEKAEIDKAIKEVGQYYEKQAERAENVTAANRIAMEELMFYLWNNQPRAVLKAAEKINLENLDDEETFGFYSLMGDAYTLLGDLAQAEKYYKLMRETAGDDYVAG